MRSSPNAQHTSPSTPERVPSLVSQSMQSARMAVAGLGLLASLSGCATTSIHSVDASEVTERTRDSAGGRERYVREVHTDGWRRLETIVTTNPHYRALQSIVGTMARAAAAYTDVVQSHEERTANRETYFQLLFTITPEQSHQLVDIVAANTGGGPQERIQMIRLISAFVTVARESMWQPDDPQVEVNYNQMALPLARFGFELEDVVALLDIATAGITDNLVRGNSLTPAIMRGIRQNLRIARLTQAQAHWLEGICRTLLIRSLDTPEPRRPLPAVAALVTPSLLAQLAHFEIRAAQ